MRLAELPEVLCLVEEGGVLGTRGAVEVATILRPDEAVPSKDSLLWSLRQQQDELFLLGK